MKIWLIIRADRTTRTTHRTPRLRQDEVGIPLTITFPKGWGAIVDEQAITLSAPAIPKVTK